MVISFLVGWVASSERAGKPKCKRNHHGGAKYYALKNFIQVCLDLDVCHGLAPVCFDLQQEQMYHGYLVYSIPRIYF